MRIFLPSEGSVNGAESVLWGIVSAEVDGEERPCGEEIDAGDGFWEKGNEDFPAETPDQDESGNGHCVHEKP